MARPKRKKVPMRFKHVQLAETMEFWEAICAHAINKAAPEERNDQDALLRKARFLWMTTYTRPGTAPKWPPAKWPFAPRESCPDDFAAIVDERYAYHWRCRFVARGFPQAKKRPASAYNMPLLAQHAV